MKTTTRPTEYYTKRLLEIASRVGWALPEQTVADLKEIAESLEQENRPFAAPINPRRNMRHIP